MTHRPFIGAALGSVVLAAGVVETVHAQGCVIYDNGPVEEVGGANSMMETSYPFYSAGADDFVFSSSDFPGAQSMTVTGVNWAGLTHPNGGLMADITDIRILIWPDAGGVPAGGQPPGLPPDESQALHNFEIPGNGNETPTGPQRFAYGLKLPESVELEMDVVYWLQIQVVTEFPPHWVWVASGDGLGIGNPAVQGFDLLGIAFWTPVPLGDTSLSFQLRGFENCPCPWDLDNTNVVGTADLLALLAAWGTDPGGPPDFNGDGNVGTSDLLELLSNWGLCS